MALQNRLQGYNVKAVSLHPGAIITEVLRHEQEGFLSRIARAGFILSIKVFGKSLEQGVQTALYCVLEDFEKLKGGAYYADCKHDKENEKAVSEENHERLWEVSENLIKEKLGEEAFQIK